MIGVVNQPIVKFHNLEKILHSYPFIIAMKPTDISLGQFDRLEPVNGIPTKMLVMS